MSESLIDKIRRSREGTIEVNGITFNFRRPTDIEVAKLYNDTDGNYSKFDVVGTFVFGWTLKESDIIDGGNDSLVPFSREIFDEWISDARDYWAPLFEAIMGAYVDFSTKRDDHVKN